MTKRSKSDQSMELSLEQLDTVIGGSGPAPMGLGGAMTASDPTRTHGDPFATRAQGHIPFIPIDHALPPAPVGDGAPSPFGLGNTGTHDHPADTVAQADSHATAVTADHVVASAPGHDPGPAGLGGGWQSDPSTTTTTTTTAQDHHDALTGDLFVPPVDAEPFATDTGSHADDGPVGLGWNGNS